MAVRGLCRFESEPLWPLPSGKAAQPAKGSADIDATAGAPGARDSL